MMTPEVCGECPFEQLKKLEQRVESGQPANLCPFLAALAMKGYPSGFEAVVAGQTAPACAEIRADAKPGTISWRVQGKVARDALGRIRRQLPTAA